MRLLCKQVVAIAVRDNLTKQAVAHYMRAMSVHNSREVQLSNE